MTRRADGAGPRDLSMIGAMIAGVGAGVAGGLGAWIFRLMIGLVHNLFFLGRLDAAYDANVHTPPSPWGAAVVLVPVVGGVGVVYLVRRFGPEVEGGGVPEVLGAITARSGEIRPSVAAVKSAASALSIGSGGSVGREGPIIQIGAAFGSALARVGRLSVADRRLLVAAGAAAGIAATFNAPFGALLFAVELLLVAISPRVMLVIGTAVVTAVLVARTLIGSGRAFTVLDLHQVDPISIDWSEGLALAALGLVIGVVSAGLIRGLGWAQDRFEGRPHHPYLAHAAAMVAVGLGMYGFFSWIGYYSIQGVGYATITDVLEESVTSPWILLALAAAKLAATTLTLSSGGSGGIFSPALFLGATLGGALGHALVAVGVDVDPVVLALGGMAGAVAGTTGALLTAVMMVTEMTGDLGALLPLLIVVVVAGPIRQRLSPATLYVSQLERRGYPLPGDRGAGDEADG